MKKILYLFVVMFGLLSQSCKKHHYETVTVLKDCTGTYIRIESEDFFVCNPEKLKSYKDHSEISIDYTKCAECKVNDFSCEMLRSFDGWLIINKIK